MSRVHIGSGFVLILARDNLDMGSKLLSLIPEFDQMKEKCKTRRL